MNRKQNSSGKATGRQKAGTNVARPLAAGEPFLPHEHDEAPGRSGRDGSEGKASRDVIEQAQKDISAGLKDTDLHGTPSNVPGPSAPRRSETDAKATGEAAAKIQPSGQ